MTEAPSLPSAEDRLIARYFAPLATHPGALGLSDDAAFLAPPPGCDLVLKTDAVVGGVHFFADDPADLVARKALRVNLSDLAAKAATPLGCLLSLALPRDVGEPWLDAFSRGLAEDTKAFGCPLFGGDTDCTPGPITVAVFVLGAVPQGAMVRRKGARPGDHVVVTGTIGDGALGLRVRADGATAARWKLGSAEAAHLVERYLLPEPRLAMADALRRYATAGMDVSDGLAGDLAKLCRVSGVSAEIAVEKIPLSAGARAALAADPMLIEPILSGGDDYEVLCTIGEGKFDDFRRAAAAAGVPVTEIGRVVEGRSLPAFRDRAGRPVALGKLSFSHF